MPLLNAPPTVAFREDEIFSKMHYRCNNVEFFEYIEPLVGILRDPLTMCDEMRRVIASHPAAGVFNHGESYVQSKRYLLLEPSASQYLPHLGTSGGGAAATRCQLSVGRLHPRRLLFDLGASTYHGWGESSESIGAKWFVERYAAFNESFDHIYAFDAAPHAPAEIFARLPAALLARYSYYNLGVTADRDSALNPWNLVRAVAQPHDHVVVKLDIDAPAIELALVEQLKASDELMVRAARACAHRTPHTRTHRTLTRTCARLAQRLVDEMFFEEHVATIAMALHWGFHFSESTKTRYVSDT